MKEIRYFYVPQASSVNELPEEEAKHAVKVLRLQAGDTIHIVDGEGGLFEAEMTMASGRHCMYNIVSKEHTEKEWQGKICLVIAPTKMMDRIEWMVEKATEIGFDEVAFLDCRFSERKTLRTDRIERIVVSAMKQSHKARKPEVRELQSFHDFILAPREGRKFIAHCYDEIPRTDFFDVLKTIDSEETVTFLVGPEGDFSIDEVRMAIDNGYEPISLGRCRLRTETAGLSGVMMANLCKRLL